uniref:Fe_hyd_lg_C domain-containing protein n=1 Tax=Steinernema glaseri TaxID=37863 RepID=A0A1I7ZG26_9BILA
MSENFSGVVRIADISDFITPAQACILPLQKTAEEPKDEGVSIRERTRVFVAAPTKKSTKVAVSLNDCLACNGCVTSAEAVLVQEQSADKMLEEIKNSEFPVVTISPQAVCSIAARRSMTVPATARLIASYLKSLGVKHVIDSSFARALTLELSYEEWLEKQKEPTPSPLFCSVCPGFVCYAEKTHGKLFVPLMSHVRSPQALSGALVKDYLARKLNIRPETIFHATVMPCFDKKLEASRSEFKMNGTIPEVDCVISTSELNQLIEGFTAEETECDGPSSSALSWLNSVEHGVMRGSMDEETSGGYGEYILRRYLEKGAADLKVKREMKMKNMEIVEVSNGDGAVVFSMAKVYGFRNIQNMVQKLKRNKFPISYVEVMACPSGCSNGGGQVRADTTEERQELLAAVNEKYKSIGGDIGDEASAMLTEWRQLNGEHEKLLKTEFRVVDRNVLGQAALRW